MYKKQKTDWSREELNRLYWVEGQSLQQIGDLYGVTKERIKQVMEQFLIPRRKKWGNHHRPHPLRFKNLSDYLLHGNYNTPTIRKFLPKNLACSECGSRRYLHMHHIIYPAKVWDDIQLLCASCHKMKHIGRMTLIKQIDLYNDYCSGICGRTLAIKYDISKASVYNVIKKIKNGSHTLRG